MLELGLRVIKMSFSLGLDIGSVGAKLSLIDNAGKFIRLDSEKITASPTAVVNSLLAGLGEEINLEQFVSPGVSASGEAVCPRE